MAARRAKVQDVVATVVEEPRTRRQAATTPEGREQQLINAAYDAAEEQILNRTASAQVITHFLKLGSTREQLEQMKLEHENQLLEAKREALASQVRVEELYKDAMTAFRSYQGEVPKMLEPGDLDED